MTIRRKYHSITVAFAGDQMETAARIAEDYGDGDYLLYEHEGEWSLGMGVAARMTVYRDETVVTDHQGEERVFANADLSVTMHEALASIEVDGWRVYGTADFELSRYLYGLELQEPERPLVKAFLPETEIRLTQSSALLRALDVDALDGLRERLESATTSCGEATPETIAVPEVETHDAEQYQQIVARAVAEIQQHDYRKVILSRRVPLSHSLDMASSYVIGRRANTPARSYFLRFDGFEAAGFSPETVVEVNDQREVFTTPLAGTRALGADWREELRLREELVSDSKEIAEHAISVYVGFDEMTMACDPRTVSVINFMLVSRRGSVQHLASRIKGTLLPSCNAWHAFNALFPAVTASGVPKKESVQSIGRYEHSPRGLYAGCVMICDQSGALDAALVLRSFFQQDGQAWLQAGAGIMNMSRPERELEETCEKLRSCSAFLVPAGG